MSEMDIIELQNLERNGPVFVPRTYRYATCDGDMVELEPSGKFARKHPGYDLDAPE